MTAERKGAPPRAGETSTAYLQVRVTSAELQRYRKAAHDAGLSISEWVRRWLDISCFEDAPKPAKASKAKRR